MAENVDKFRPFLPATQIYKFILLPIDFIGKVGVGEEREIDATASTYRGSVNPSRN